MKKLVILFVLFTVYCFLFASSALAKDFSSYNKTTYEFSINGNAFVTQEISLVNINPNLYVSEYTFSTTGGEISDIQAYDKIGPLKIKNSIKDKSTLITLTLNEKVVGKGKVLSFILKYKVKDLAKKEGNLWQITIPKLYDQSTIDDYQLLLKTPKEFGKLAYVNPDPKSYEETETDILIGFSKENLIQYGVLATFGQYQSLKFDLIYDLKNDSSEIRKEKIVIPPDTNYQSVYYTSFKPLPEDVEVDEDGNWLAIFKLDAKEKKTINIAGKVNIFSKPRQDFSKKQTDPNRFLNSEKYWPIDNPKILSLSKKLKSVEEIYNFVVKTLDYDYQLAEKNASRKGAVFSLENPKSSVCTEFTDLFITLARAAGIPAREIEGYAWTDNPILSKIAQEKDLLHSWPEYYDSETGNWIMVDPTWEKTTGGLDYFNKMDMAHFAFVIHGISDTIPFSPGSYRDDSSSGKQVFVSLSNEMDSPKPKDFSIEQVNLKSIYSLVSGKEEITLRNMSGYSLYNEDIVVKSSEKISPQSFKLSFFPPYSITKLNFKVTPRELLKDYNSDLTIQSGNREEKIQISIKSLGIRLILLSSGVISAMIILILSSVRKARNNEKAFKKFNS